MSTPLFSVVIPTRNRAALLGECIDSALGQTFDDFEVVVSDNWNGPDTAEVLARYEGRPRFRHVRTSRALNMPEHWDFASAQATGQYVLFLNDRMVMRPSALRVAAGALHRASQPDVCVWGIQHFTDDSHVLLPEPLPGTEEKVVSRRILLDIARNNRPEWWRLPRMVNGCIARGRLKRLQDRFGTIFRPISPDFTSGFIVLAHVPEILCIGRPFVLSRGLSTSTGLNTQKAAGGSYLDSLGNAVDPSRLVPVKTFSVWNSVFSDFQTTKELLGPAFPDVALDLPRYFAACIEELELMQRMSPDIDQRDARREWARALAESGISPKLVEAARQVPYRRRARLKDAILRHPFGRELRHVKRRLTTLRQRIVGPVFESALDAARRTDAMIQSDARTQRPDASS